MIKKMSHATIYVLDQDEALAFYTEKLGFVVRTDVTMGAFRWLTVSPPGQQLELVLMKPVVGMGQDEETVAQLRALVAAGAMGAGVMSTDDCQATYEVLRGRGVTFSSPPTERPYGVEATFQDCSGNWFSLTEHR